MKKEILIALDGGYSGGKIVVNGNVYFIPFIIQDITDEINKYELRRVDSDYITVKSKERTYLIGKVAQTYLLENSRNQNKRSIMEAFYTMERYNMPIFKTALSAYIAYGLARYAMDCEDFNIENIGDWKIRVGIALPHKYVDDLVPICENILTTKQELELTIGSNAPLKFNYSIEETFYNSQIVCLLINEVVDDKGEEITEESVYDNLPAIILDGGYKTFGEFEFARDQSITGDDSNLDFAMININHKVSEAISAKIGGYNDYMIDELYMNGDVVHYQNDDGVIEEIDVVKLKDQLLEETSAAMIDHLLEKYDSLLRTKMILIGGGTGAAYYPYIKKFCDEQRKYLSEKVILAGQRPFKGQELSPVFAVACGLYKDMLMQLNARE